LAAALTSLAHIQNVELVFVRSNLIVESDPVMLDRILGNLIENAIRHSGGRRVLIGCRRHSDTLRVHVIDNGRGMRSLPATDKAETSVGSGLGLGLHIVADTAKALGHSVDMMSGDRGTNAILTLPKSETVTIEHRAETGPSPLLFGSVLIIEDDAEVRYALAMTLQRAGMSVASATTHAEALSMIAGLERQPDLLIIDYHLPDARRGTETYRLVEQVIGRVIPTLFITGSTEPNDLADLDQHGWPVLTKPISPTRLLGAAEAILANTSDRKRAV